MDNTPDSTAETEITTPGDTSRSERYEKIFRYSNDAILIVDFDSESIVDANPAAIEMLGYDREELLEIDLVELHPQDIDRLRNEFFTHVATDGSGWTDDLTCVTKSGEVKPIEVSGAILENEGTENDSSRLVAMLRDISERKQREAEVRKSFEELARILDSVDDLVFLHTGDGDMKYVNESAVNRLGYDGVGPLRDDAGGLHGRGRCTVRGLGRSGQRRRDDEIRGDLPDGTGGGPSRRSTHLHDPVPWRPGIPQCGTGQRPPQHPCL